MQEKSKNVCVVVLGDIGRSPRMQYHSLSLAHMGHKVDIIGYGDSEPMDEVKKTPLLFYHFMVPCPQLSIKLVNYAFKTIWQAVNLLFLLCICRKPDYLIVQNPPAIPSLIICYIFSRLTRAKFIIDWHNYAHTIMALNLKPTHPLVRITKKVENYIGQKADHSFCVTKAMKADLKQNWNIEASTLYDKPPKIFHSITLEEKHEFIKKMGKKYPQLMEDSNEDCTVFTENIDGEVKLKRNRPGLLVSSTSWTEDEDFSVLFLSLQEFEDHHNSGNSRNLPDLICIITGKGHLKDYYCSKITGQNWTHVTVITPWLESEDYPLILASADLGVCLHTSSSGLDLPMKVVDMFGSGLPVCAFDFKCLNELVQHEKNSYTFKTSEELSSQLLTWFENFGNNKKQVDIVEKFKNEIKSFQQLRWDENWEMMASSYFK